VNTAEISIKKPPLGPHGKRKITPPPRKNQIKSVYRLPRISKIKPESTITNRLGIAEAYCPKL
jgi:hypothetical protein